MYLEPWHFDIFDFLELKKNTGKEEQRARDLFYGLWIPDLFMKRVESNGVSILVNPVHMNYSSASSYQAQKLMCESHPMQDWSLMCPSNSPGLDECWGEEFEKLYTRYESNVMSL